MKVCKQKFTISRLCLPFTSVHFLFAAPCTDGQLRLAGNVDNEGRVEICLNNEWGTICDDNWHTNDANVACSVLGFSSTGELLL